MNLKGNRLLTGDGSFTPLELTHLFSALIRTRGVSTNDKLAFVSERPDKLIGTLAGIATFETDSIVIPLPRLDERIRARIESDGYFLINLDDKCAPIRGARGCAGESGKVVILSSGTTGVPKLIPHSWDTLFTFKDVMTPQKRTWLLTYEAGSYAWYQMAAMWLFLEGQDLVVPSSSDPQQMWEAGLAVQFDAISSTPTFWRHLLITIGKQDIRLATLRQITLGGEPVNQDILSHLKDLFPAAKITHIYASSEAGASVIVNDGKEGFPIEWLRKQSPDRPSLRVDGDRLFVRSPFASTAITEWHDTGDIVELRKGRVVLLGRADGHVLNIGGRKVYSKTIEDILLKSPYVSWCRVYARQASLAGNVVQADIVGTPALVSLAPEEREENLSSYCREHLSDTWMVPRIFKILPKIPMSNNFKSSLRNRAGNEG